MELLAVVYLPGTRLHNVISLLFHLSGVMGARVGSARLELTILNRAEAKGGDEAIWPTCQQRKRGSGVVMKRNR